MIGVEDRGGVAVVRWEHGKVNALDLELLEAIGKTFDGLGEADAVVVTGGGRAFSAGVDLRRLVDGGPEYVGAFLPALSRALLAIFDFPRPVVAAVNGHAIAGGCVLAAACDRRLMSAGTIGLTEILVGVPFPSSAFEIMKWAVGPEVNSLVLTGGTVRPDEAVTLGLVHEVLEADTLLDGAVARAGTLGRIPRRTYAMTKQQLHREASQAIAGATAWDADVLEVWQSPGTIGGIARYLDSLGAR